MEFHVDCLSSCDDACAFMATNFSVNPVGAEFDPDEWLARLRAGEREAEFLSRRVREPVPPLRGAFEKYLAQ